MEDTTILEPLYALGMKVREARLYYAMLQQPESNALMLQRLSGVPRNKIYETLERMVRNGYCMERIEGRQKFYRAVNPEHIHEALKKKRDVEWEHQRSAAEEAVGCIGQLFNNRANTDRSLDFIEVIRSSEQINLRYLQLMREAQEEVLVFNRSPYACLDPAILAEQQEVGTDASNRGVRAKTIYMVEEADWEWLEPDIHLELSQGEEGRLTSDLPMKMFVFDRKKVMLALPSIPGQTGNDFTMVIIEDPGFTLSCQMLFQTYWNASYDCKGWLDKKLPAAELIKKLKPQISFDM